MSHSIFHRFLLLAPIWLICCGMVMDDKSMVMHGNSDRLPEGCVEVSEDINITVHAGRKYAAEFNGKTFAFDQQEWHVPACSRLHVTLINDDTIRHQFMVHGLPAYIYPQGMFHMELYGKGEVTGTLIVPAKKKTYLVHCEIPQHQEHGMKAQLKVAGGDGDLPSIPGISDPVTPDNYPLEWSLPSYLVGLIAIFMGLLIPWGIQRWGRSQSNKM